ncbi:MAG: type II toxin-antitoxin system Phd/YefM family antitoxin [Acidimicrobiales bacterium]
MATMSVTEARANLPEVLDRVLAGEEVTITRHGVAVAVVVRPDALAARRAERARTAAETVRDVLESGRRAPLEQQPTLSRQRAQAIISGVRADRAGR